jgi:hypothetical protein
VIDGEIANAETDQQQAERRARDLRDRHIPIRGAEGVAVERAPAIRSCSISTAARSFPDDADQRALESVAALRVLTGWHC